MLFLSKMYEPIVIKFDQVTINFNGLGNDIWRFDQEPVR